MKHISEILPKVMADIDFATEVNRLTSRHIAKLLSRLEERYSIEQEIVNAIKVQFRMLADDIINNAGDKKDEQPNFQD
jgi:ubiquinone biosynthesis protein COQ9